MSERLKRRDPYQPERSRAGHLRCGPPGEGPVAKRPSCGKEGPSRVARREEKDSRGPGSLKPEKTGRRARSTRLCTRTIYSLEK